MRSLLLSALLLAWAFQTALGQHSEDWSYSVQNNQATITAYTGAGGAVTIPSTLNEYPVTSIGRSAFQYCYSLTSISIPNSVTSIGDSAFYSCTSLTSISIPNSVTTIGWSAFQNCTGLTSITIPDSVTSIYDGTFAGCTNLPSLTIPNSVTSIGERAFNSCYRLTNINLPSGVTTIGELAFNNCTSLTSITIPNSVTSIGRWTFWSCTGLSSATIGSGVTNIGMRAFNNCYNLKSIYFLGNAPTWVEPLFWNSTPTVYYFAGSTGWGENYAGRPTALLLGFNLSVTCDSTKGTVAKSPDSAPYILGAQVRLTVTPKAGYLLTAWSGDSTASTTSITLTMDSDKSVTANFAQDSGDNDADGLSNFEESITYGTNPDSKDSNNDNIEDGQAVALGYSPTFNFSSLISHLQSHPPTGLYTASQMQAMAIGDLVLTKNINGSFTLNYEIEQSTDLQTWNRYQALSLPLTGLPTDKAFVRIKAKQ